MNDDYASWARQQELDEQEQWEEIHNLLDEGEGAIESIMSKNGSTSIQDMSTNYAAEWREKLSRLLRLPEGV